MLNGYQYYVPEQLSRSTNLTNQLELKQICK